MDRTSRGPVGDCGGRGSLRLPSVTVEGRRYALRELARRAGVSRDFFQSWSIDIFPDHTAVAFGSGSNGRIQFVHSTESERLAGDTIPVGRAGWFGGRPSPLAESDLVVPFCNSGPSSPLYVPGHDGGLVCRLDLLSSMLYTLSRVEETLTSIVDEHRRFPASASLAFQYEFLERPILDEHGLAFQQALCSLVPNWKPDPRPFQFKLTHDIDEIGIPFSLHSSIGHSLKRSKPAATVRNLFSNLGFAEPTELTLVRKLAGMSISRGLQSAFYWKASPFGPRDSGYDPGQPKVQRVIDSLRESGFELGVHPGYDTFGDRPALVSEVHYLRQVLRVESPGGRQHYLRWSPDTWLDWEACGLSYDSSLGYADRFGFRAGTAFPYRPWSFQNNRELNLIEVPLVLMDCTPVKYMRLSRSEGLKRIRKVAQRVAHTGGVFTLLWHNTPFLDADYDGWYESILDLLTGTRSFDLPSDAKDLW